jgi:hypothetical protein
MSAETPHPVSVSVDDELGRRGSMKQVMVEGALEVAKDALHMSEVHPCGATLVGPRSSRVIGRGIHVEGDLGLSVD